MEKITNDDLLYQTSFIQRKFERLIDYLKEDIMIINDPEAQRLFENSADVISGLKKAFRDYEQKKVELY